MAGDLFKYEVDPLSQRGPNKLAAVVPSGITSSDRLLQVLYEELQLPSYFGFNWNALSDCLRDLHWVSHRDVFIIHEELPALSRSDLEVYLEVLDECSRDWKAEEAHRVVVVFPQARRAEIDSLIGAAASD